MSTKSVLFLIKILSFFPLFCHILEFEGGGQAMFHLFDKAILGMSILRLLSGTIEIIVALVILKLNHVEKALMINSMLAIVGPIILILTTSIGLIGLADKISLTKIFWIVIGICFILYGVNSK